MAEWEVRFIRADELDAVLDLLAPWEGRAYFERYFLLDPAFRPEHVCAAFDGARPVSCAQVVPRTVRVVGGTAQVGGVGQVWTEPGYRGQGLAPRVLRHCVAMMRQERFALSLLFASRFDFYSALGWRPYLRTRSVLVGCPDRAPACHMDTFDVARDLAHVRALYDMYTAAVPGMVVRDAAGWEGTLHLAGIPSETFLVARDATGRLTAYMRGTVSGGVYVVMEYAYAAEGLEAMGALLAAHWTRARDVADVVQVDGAHDSALRASLSAQGFQLNPVEDPFIMWRVIDPTALPQPAPPVANADEELALLKRLLPQDRYTYWHADRF